MPRFYTGPLSGALSAPYIGPGDIVSGALAWWGLRAYSSAQAKGTQNAIDVTDQAGANPLTVKILGTGSLDIPSINTWVAAHSVTQINVSKWYDQSGNGIDVLQATNANRPILILPNVAGFGNGLAVISANPPSGQLLESSANLVPSNLSQPFSGSFVGQAVGSVNNAYWDDNNGAVQFGYHFTSVQTVGFSAGAGIGANVNTGVSNAVQGLFNGTSSILLIDGASSSGNAGTGPLSAIPFGFAIGGGSGTAYLGEFGLWGSDISAHFAALNTNQHVYWGF